MEIMLLFLIIILICTQSNFLTLRKPTVNYLINTAMKAEMKHIKSIQTDILQV